MFLKTIQNINIIFFYKKLICQQRRRHNRIGPIFTAFNNLIILDPPALYHPEGEYLKGLVLYVE